MENSIIKIVMSASNSVKNGRRVGDIFTYAIEEIGELSTEISIQNGLSKKRPGVDGITGEAIDVIVTILDLIFVNDPRVTEAEIVEIVTKKCNKWVSKWNEQ